MLPALTPPEAFAKLTARQREAFELIAAKNLSYSQAARVMGISPQCVHKTYYAAIRKIARLTG
jgi:DNA-directed RNA polymerase specialized sigma24 family protein